MRFKMHLVNFFAEHKDYLEVRRLQNEILGQYEDDFGKNADNAELARIRTVWNSIFWNGFYGSKLDYIEQDYLTNIPLYALCYMQYVTWQNFWKLLIIGVLSQRVFGIVGLCQNNCWQKSQQVIFHNDTTIKVVWAAWVKRRYFMYHYIEDKDFLNRMKSLCSSIINQLVQSINNDTVMTAKAELIGSGAKDLVTQNAKKDLNKRK